MKKIITDSALSDKFKEFLMQFKDEKGFKYVEMIANCIKTNQTIQINEKDFTKEVNDLFEGQTIITIQKAIYRAVKEIFANDEGVSRTSVAVKEDRIKIKYKKIIFGRLIKNENDDDEVKFNVNRGGKSFKVTVLEHPITSLRPITLLRDETKYILVYLPVREKEISEKTTEPNFFNKAFFVINNKIKNKDQERKLILPIEHNELKENFRIKVLPEWNESRWEYDDLTLWIDETEQTDPAKLYNLHDKTIREYIEFANEFDYSYFNIWNIATYFYELFDAFPYNDYTGTKRAGKTKSLELQKLVCFNPIMSADISGSAMFRTIEGIGATVLLDESEQFKNPKNEQAQHIRTLFLQGFIRGQFAVRSEGKANEGFTPQQFNLYSPKSLAHINGIGDVLEDRCIPQLMRRSKDKSMLNSWPDSRKDKRFTEIRNLCYRLFLDYANEIYELQDEAKKLLSISGRELRLWTPIITLALFFQKHGIENLVKKIQIKTNESSKDRQLYDEEESRDLQLIDFCDKIGVTLTEQEDSIKNNPKGWIPTEELYKRLIDEENASKYGINPEYFSRKKFSETLRRIGLKKEKKKGGISWLITRREIDEIKERMGMIEPKQATLDSSSLSSFSSLSSPQAQEPTSKSEPSEASEVNDAK